MVAGIYVIYGPGNRVYIGQSRNVHARFAWHIRDLSKRRHTNPLLQAAWRKFGSTSFRFEFIEQLPRKRSTLIAAETKWMRAYIKAGWLLYNVHVT